MVLAAVVQKIGEIEAERRISIVVAPNEIAVQKHKRAAKGSVELDDGASPGIFLRCIEDAAVPADAGFGIAATERFVAVAVLFLVAYERQFHGPIVRQVQWTPFGVVEFLRGKPEFAAFGEVSLAHAEAQIARWVGTVSLKKLPA